MKLITQHIHGRFQDGVLTLIDTDPKEKTAVSLYLLFPYTTYGDKIHIFPSSMLDDRGREIRGMQLYEWVRENGEYSPRAEIFGVDGNGRSTQEFLRGFELNFRFPCYLHQIDGVPFTPINRIILPADTQRKELPYPLRRAKAAAISNEQ